MEVPRPRIESELQQQHQVFYPLHWAKDRTHTSAVTWAAAVRFLTCCTTAGILWTIFPKIIDIILPEEFGTRAFPHYKDVKGSLCEKGTKQKCCWINHLATCSLAAVSQGSTCLEKPRSQERFRAQGMKRQRKGKTVRPAVHSCWGEALESLGIGDAARVAELQVWLVPFSIPDAVCLESAQFTKKRKCAVIFNYSFCRSQRHRQLLSPGWDVAALPENKGVFSIFHHTLFHGWPHWWSREIRKSAVSKPVFGHLC